MGHVLRFEEKWDKTLDDKDRDKIKQIFNQANLSTEQAIQFTPLWQAINYKNELLVTVLIHNKSNNDYSFHQTELCYMVANQILAKATFTVPSLSIEKHTSKPWTFIFSEHKVTDLKNNENGNLQLNNSFH